MQEIREAYKILSCDTFTDDDVRRQLWFHLSSMGRCRQAHDIICELSVTFSRQFLVAARSCGENILLSSQAGGFKDTLAFRENTIPSFRQVILDGASFVEFDVQVTRDNVPVL